ncbi:MarR family winged helix-turn-helix transcriptional regulator [Actinacidiphila bryophytorum]|uniref:Transcriptional regulator, MarR family n=1 Tax=Actinacidiphila bryophytorum TaxID=1436133 RepID=A0A9W4H0M8_9ACTN|nr:MarR family transcriptional regulator [Actinacidiphila bryophytorum]MBM9438791.1 MarR family transcriptional regulator [Actinacidiphila bryophytorum]MBN6541853.1 MarR family transcriptional regulator [Actinacidiphila bryophytorum]CAG7638344.1 Transcriptional regulator, MarR family [Actinacidiphila bryophytorum]
MNAMTWLTEEQQATWRAFLHATTLLEDHLDRQLQRDAHMPHMYYALLSTLSETPARRMRMTELAEQAKITRSRLSHAVARLEGNGWVRRENCPTDRRGQVCVLTDAGYAELERTAPGHVAAVRTAVFDRLTAEQTRQLGDISRIIADGLHQPDGADVPWLR